MRPGETYMSSQNDKRIELDLGQQCAISRPHEQERSPRAVVQKSFGAAASFEQACRSLALKDKQLPQMIGAYKSHPIDRRAAETSQLLMWQIHSPLSAVGLQVAQDVG